MGCVRASLNYSEISLDDVPLFDENGRHAAPVADWSPSANDPSRQTELRMALGAALAELPPHHRTALILHDVEGLSNVEVAETLGLGVPNVKSRVHRARLFLRKRLADVHVDRGGDDGRSGSAVNIPARARVSGAQRLEGGAAKRGIDAG